MEKELSFGKTLGAGGNVGGKGGSMGQGHKMIWKSPVAMKVWWGFRMVSLDGQDQHNRCITEEMGHSKPCL
ncbi:hypothetical protein Sjap_018218 [Stephania japonica]|uniref:Uncharacterized protein n=1 Tax=Stephania japonica TaxID=461633 RepID=A0AAP0I7K8_9MAGN